MDGISSNPVEKAVSWTDKDVARHGCLPGPVGGPTPGPGPEHPGRSSLSRTTSDSYHVC